MRHLSVNQVTVVTCRSPIVHMDDVYGQFHVSHWDLQNENRPNRRPKSSKKKALYGVFAGDSDDSDDAGDRSAKKKTKDVRFVSGSNAGLSEESVKEAGTSRQRTRPAQTFAGLDLHRETQEIGKWQKHTTGIGSKLLSKMGWDPGKGLGKNLQGIAVPIEAAVRASGTGIGAAGPELKQGSLFLDARDDHSPPESSTARHKTKEKVRKNYVMKSVDQLIDEEIGMGTFSETVTSSMKVLDMRGPETKVLSGYHEICGADQTSEEPGNETEKSIHCTESFW